MTCPECGTKLGVFRRKFSNTAYCSEACRLAALQTQNQASLALMLSNKNRHLAQAKPVPAPPPVPEPAREAVHSGVMAGFAPFGRAGVHSAPAAVALLDETPAAIETGVRWQEAVLHAARPGLALTRRVSGAMKCMPPRPAVPAAPGAAAAADWGTSWQDPTRQAARPGLAITGWLITAISCLQPRAAALPAPIGELGLPLAIARARVCDTLHPVWEPPAAVTECQAEKKPVPSRWIAARLAATRLPDRWLGLSAFGEFEIPTQRPQFRSALERPEFAPYAACRPSSGHLPAGPRPVG